MEKQQQKDRFKSILIEANESFNFVLDKKPDVYEEKDRAVYVYGYICQEFEDETIQF